jgi:hypothetical protein
MHRRIVTGGQRFHDLVPDPTFRQRTNRLLQVVYRSATEGACVSVRAGITPSPRGRPADFLLVYLLAQVSFCPLWIRWPTCRSVR